MTKLTQSAFADELAAFYHCNRVERGELVGGRFAGEQLSPRFLREERLFPYEDRSGMLTLAVARPIDDETVRAAEVALRRAVAKYIVAGRRASALLAAHRSSGHWMTFSAWR